MMNKQKLVEQLEKHEGLRLNPYTDTVGKLTIGIGRNLEDKGITPDEARFMLNNDIVYFANEVSRLFAPFNSLDNARQNVLINMAFNLGVAGLFTFKNFLSCVMVGDFDKAAIEMLNSKWARQVGNRANELAEQMRTGDYK